MTNPQRTATPEIDAMWDRPTTIDRWHRLWIWHLDQQRKLNPDHPANRGKGVPDEQRYQAAADIFADPRNQPTWLREIDEEETKTRHDLAAALAVFNRRAGASTAHLGLTSHDIVETARQQATLQSLRWVQNRADEIVRRLVSRAQQLRGIATVGRTHGQPAQAIPYALRWATIIDTLDLWVIRADDWADSYPTRPPHGAVGTAADLTRVVGNGLVGEGIRGLHRQYLSGDTAAASTADVTRQVPHRSHDLHTASLLLQLGLIARSWAADRRLEAMLGHGNESRDPGQVGSSAMPHKANPVLSERIHGLYAVLAGYHATAVATAGDEWLEGDVAGSSARRHWLPGMFQAAAQILVNWGQAIDRWQVDRDAIQTDLEAHELEIHTGAAMWWLVDAGIPRDIAHQWVARAMAEVTPGSSGDTAALAHRLAHIAGEQYGDGGTSDLQIDLQALQDSWKAWRLNLEYVERQIDIVLSRELP